MQSNSDGQLILAFTIMYKNALLRAEKLAQKGKNSPLWAVIPSLWLSQYYCYKEQC